MYEVKKAITLNMYDLFVNGIHVLRESKSNVEEFIVNKVKPLGLVTNSAGN